MRDLGTLGGTDYTVSYDINDSGQVVVTNSDRSFITGPDGMGMKDLGNVYAEALNAGAGRNVPRGGGANSFYHGAEWRRQKGPEGRAVGGHPLAINSAGQITGIYGDLNPQVLSPAPNGVGMTVLGTLGGTYSTSFSGRWHQRCRAGGGVLLTTAEGAYHAFITGPNGVGMTDLGTLGGG